MFQVIQEMKLHILSSILGDGNHEPTINPYTSILGNFLIPPKDNWFRADKVTLVIFYQSQFEHFHFPKKCEHTHTHTHTHTHIYIYIYIYMHEDSRKT